MKKAHLLTLFLCSLSCAGVNTASAASSGTDQTLEIARRVADWQLENPYTCFLLGHWINGVYLNGLFAIGQMPNK